MMLVKQPGGVWDRENGHDQLWTSNRDLPTEAQKTDTSVLKPVKHWIPVYLSSAWCAGVPPPLCSFHIPMVITLSSDMKKFLLHCFSPSPLMRRRSWKSKPRDLHLSFVPSRFGPLLPVKALVSLGIQTWSPKMITGGPDQFFVLRLDFGRVPKRQDTLNVQCLFTNTVISFWCLWM